MDTINRTETSHTWTEGGRCRTPGCRERVVHRLGRAALYCPRCETRIKARVKQELASEERALRARYRYQKAAGTPAGEQTEEI
jgi:predicted sulfurtransferase